MQRTKKFWLHGKEITDKDEVFERNLKILIGIGVVATICVFMLVKYLIVMHNYKSELKAYVEDKIKSEYINSYTLSGSKCKYLNLTLNDKFDTLSTKKKYHILKNIMEKYDDKRFNLQLDYDIYDKNNAKNNSPLIQARTSKSKYTMTSTGYFTDADGKEYNEYDFKDYSYTSTNNNSSGSASSSLVYNLTREQKIEAYTAAQFYAKNKLKSPSSAKFAWFKEDYVTSSNGNIVVSAWVEAQNSYGATLRRFFICKMDGNYNLISVTILE